MDLNSPLTPGQTPISEEERDGLLLPIDTLNELDRAERRNIVLGLAKISMKQRAPEVVIQEDFIKQFHFSLFNRVWAWAGQFRRTGKNMGVPWPEIPVAYRQLRDDTLFWINEQTFPPDEIAIRYKHRLVIIHPFPNGNGRHSRLMADLLTESLGEPVFSWGIGLPDPRATYLAALKQADGGVVKPLLEFARQ